MDHRNVQQILFQRKGKLVCISIFVFHYAYCKNRERVAKNSPKDKASANSKNKPIVEYKGRGLCTGLFNDPYALEFEPPVVKNACQMACVDSQWKNCCSEWPSVFDADIICCA